MVCGEGPSGPAPAKTAASNRNRWSTKAGDGTIFSAWSALRSRRFERERRARLAASNGGTEHTKKSVFGRFSGSKKQKEYFFEKLTGEVVENKGSCPEREPDRTGTRSGEVVENT